MNINLHPPQVPILNSDVIRPQKSPDSSPESTVIQNRNVAPVPDTRVVQQAGESANSNALQDPKLDVNQEEGAQEQNDGIAKQADQGQAKANYSSQLNEDELREVQQFAERDREVRAHEQAHLSAAGSRATSGASFTYVDGPDGKRYATGGEVSVDTSPVQGDPEATLRAAELIQRAALAPAEPSVQDRQVAAAASTMAQAASAEISQQRADEARPVSSETDARDQTTVSDAEAVGAVSIEDSSSLSADGTSIGGNEQSPVNVSVDRRDAQVQNRQQLLENVFSTVERGVEGDPRGGNLDNFQPAGQVSNPTLNVAQSSESESKTGIDARSVAQNIRAESGPQNEDEAHLSPAETIQASVPVDEVSVATGESVREASVDTRDEQIKNRQQRMEEVFSEVTQGLGGEPRGTNLDYFL